jgi:ribulose-5-phosphate 4-epimerase/fuculose-1-phosphate aldolase
MLVNNIHLGSSLAAEFDATECEAKIVSADPSKDDEDCPCQPNSHKYAVVLMSNHGFATHGQSIRQAVYRAIYTQVNASVQTKSTVQQAAEGNSEDILLLGQTPGAPNEIIMRETAEMNETSQDRAWELWKREVQSDNLYRNNIGTQIALRCRL